MNFNELSAFLYEKNIVEKDDVDNVILKFKQYYEFLINENEKYNLTAITKLNEVISKHFYDSLMLASFMNLKNFKVLDIGSGAGFPGIPLAIVCPNTSFFLCEPSKKRCVFLEKVIELLKLKNVFIINSRSEDLNGNYREFFDLVTSRAVSILNILCELSVPFLKIGGYFVPYKGSNYKFELDCSTKCFNKLKIKVEKIEEYILDDDNMHSLIFIKKYAKTQLKFPRNYSMIKNNPL